MGALGEKQNQKNQQRILKIEDIAISVYGVSHTKINTSDYETIQLCLVCFVNSNIEKACNIDIA